jgi:hypothetical protein
MKWSFRGPIFFEKLFKKSFCANRIKHVFLVAIVEQNKLECWSPSFFRGGIVLERKVGAYPKGGPP